MANLECSECGDLVDVEARSVVLPFVCKWCQESFGPSIVEFTAPVFDGGWIRSGNPGTKGVFSTKTEARRAIAKETDGWEYRVATLPAKPEPPCQEESIPDLDEQFELDSVLIADLEKQLAEANRNVECWKDQYTALLTETQYDRILKDFGVRAYLPEKRKTWLQKLFS